MNKNNFDLDEQLLKDTLISISKCHHICNLVIPGQFNEVNNASINKFTIEFASEIKDLLSKIEKINNKIKSNKYSIQHVAQNAFRELNSDIDYFKIQSKAIEDSLIRQKEKILQHEEFNSTSRGFVIFLNDTLFDISVFYQKLCQYQDIDISNIPKMAKRKKNNSREIFLSSLSLLRKETYINDITSVPTCIFLIRQLIELRLFEIFGIEDIEDNNGNSLKITTDKFLDVKGIDDNVILPKNLTKSIIKDIHKWTNYYIHRGYIWDYWLIEFAQYLLYDFICEDLYIYSPYYDVDYIDLLASKLSNKNMKLTENNIKRAKPCMNFIHSRKEFEDVKKEIKKYGYEEFYKKKDKELLSKI